ncbi:MAG: RagB/SusD family nutrient uptake outer membrane protein [Chitinophagaceae bacterium]|nr:RagB/SusD family nutrient uptake outer membrane protein [Chitinophagaceae bacterium]
MSKKLVYIAILLIGIGATSCEKYFEVTNSDKNSIPVNFSTIEGFRSNLAGAYAFSYEYYSNEGFYIYPEVAGNMTDLIVTGLDVLQQQFDFVSSPDDVTRAVGHLWIAIQKPIANVNNIIEFAPGFIQANPDKKSEIDGIVAQAKFIRALAQFDLCRVYAQPYNYTADASHPGIPVVTRNPAPEDRVPRATVKEAYDQIIKDLKEAELLLGNAASEGPYFASKKAVQALLARVYLYAENWDEAIAYATTVINSSTVAQGPAYISMFNGNIAGEEAIFRLSSKNRKKGLGEAYSVKGPVYVPADTLMSLFDDPSDIRLQLFATGSQVLTKKWTITVPYGPNEDRYDPMVLRTSEMYFIRAEANLAKDKLAQCEDDLKVMIGRALGKTPNDIVLDGTKEGLKRTIIRERAKEFCFEGHNFFDIVRMKQDLIRGASTRSLVKRLNYPNDRFVLPIPQDELDANPAMKGNPTVNK